MVMVERETRAARDRERQRSVGGGVTEHRQGGGGDEGGGDELGRVGAVVGVDQVPYAIIIVIVYIF